MDYIALISIIVSFVIVINRIRKQDRKLIHDLAVINADIQMVKRKIGMSVNSVDIVTGEVVEVGDNGIDNTNADWQWVS